jgi:hypothetical protein
MKPTIAQVIEERWYRGRLRYKLHAGQNVLRDRYENNPNQLFVAECSRQFGKSFEMVVGALELAHQIPNARIKYGTAFHSDLLDFILPAFDIVLQDCPEKIRPKYNVQASKYICYNGSEIKLVGLDRKPNGLRGNSIDRIILDEAGFISNLGYLYKSVIIPATTHRPNCRVFMVSTPPSTPAHEFMDFVQKAQIEGGYCKLTIYDNPMVDARTIERLKYESGGEESSTWKREYMCEHVLDTNLAIIPEWKDEYVQEIERDCYWPFYHRYNGMDLGTSHFTAGLFGYYDFIKASLIIEDEYVINGPTLTTQILKDKIVEKETEVWEGHKPYLRVSDNNNPLLLQDLSYLHGLHFTPTDKGTLEEMINAVRLMVAKGQIIVHPRCKQLTGCLKYGVWNKRREKFEESKVYGHFDALAALVYMVRNLDKATNPIPLNYGLDQDHDFFRQKERETPGSQTLRQVFGLRK